MESSQFDREGLRRSAPYLHRVAIAEQDVREAGRRLQRWQALGVNDPADLEVMDRIQDLGDQIDAQVPGTTWASLSDLRRIEIRAWASELESQPWSESDAGPLPDQTTTFSSSIVDVNDSLTMKERRVYECIRAQEWSNLRVSEYEGFRLEKSRVFATLTEPHTEVPNHEASVASSL